MSHFKYVSPLSLRSTHSLLWFHSLHQPRYPMPSTATYLILQPPTSTYPAQRCQRVEQSSSDSNVIILLRNSPLVNIAHPIRSYLLDPAFHPLSHHLPLVYELHLEFSTLQGFQRISEEMLPTIIPPVPAFPPPSLAQNSIPVRIPQTPFTDGKTAFLYSVCIILTFTSLHVAFKWL